MTLLSLTAYAETHGASRQAAAKWKSRGVLVFSGDLVDVGASDERMRGAGLGRFKDGADPRNLGGNHPQPVAGSVADAVAPAVAAAVDQVVTDLAAAVADGEIPEEAVEDFVASLLAGKVLTKVDAEAVKESGLALKHMLAARKAAGVLVDVELAEKVIFEDRRAARDAWINWPARIGPLLAADLGVDAKQLVEALTPYVHQQLDDLGEPDLDFTGDSED